MKQINKAPKHWSEEELLGWAQGENKAGRGINDQQLADSVKARFDFEAENIDEVKAKLIETLGAEKEEESVDAPEEDTPEEIVEKEVEPKGETEPKSAPEPEPEPEPKPEAAPRGETTSVQHVDEVPFYTKGQKSTTLMIVEDNLKKYVDTMRPGVAHQGTQGPATQVMLYRTIQTVLRQSGGDFDFMFGQLLKTVHEHRKTVFNERYVFRYFDRLTLTNVERRNFERFLNMMLTVCDPATRSHAIKQVDIDATMEGFKDADAHQRVVAFFQV